MSKVEEIKNEIRLLEKLRLELLEKYRIADSESNALLAATLGMAVKLVETAQLDAENKIRDQK